MIVMITGSAGGIGRATAEYFIQNGHEVHGLDLISPDPKIAAPGDSLTAEVSGETGGRYIHHIADVTKPETFPSGVRPHILISCAGVQNTGSDIEVNLKGVINITERYALENEEILSVVNVGSASGHTGSEFPEYSASKGGVIAYTRNVALRLAPRAICNSIDPGGVMTELNRCVMEDEELWEQIMDLTPLKRWAEPEEIAQWIYFVGVTNRFMTGQNLVIDGGEAGYNKFIWKD